MLNSTANTSSLIIGPECTDILRYFSKKSPAVQQTWLKNLQTYIKKAVDSNDIQKVEKLLFVVNPQDNHWAYVKMDLVKLQTLVIDSMSEISGNDFLLSFPVCMNNLLMEIKKGFLKDRFHVPEFFDMNNSSWKHESLPLGLQNDVSSCGPFTCLLLERETQNKALDIPQNIVRSYGRVRIFVKILRHVSNRTTGMNYPIVNNWIS